MCFEMVVPGPGVTAVVHCEELLETAASVHVTDGEKSMLSVIAPVGAIAAPVLLSVTVAVHLVCWFTTTVLGLQLKLTELDLRTVRVKLPWLDRKEALPPYAAVIMLAPAELVLGLYETAQLDCPAIVVAASVHPAALNFPDMSLVKETVPVGAVRGELRSVTVAVHCVDPPTSMAPGEQLTVVPDELSAGGSTINVKVEEEAWPSAPVAVTVTEKVPCWADELAVRVMVSCTPEGESVIGFVANDRVLPEGRVDVDSVTLCAPPLTVAVRVAGPSPGETVTLFVLSTTETVG